MSFAAVAFPDVSSGGQGVQTITPGPPDIGTETALPPPPPPSADPAARDEALAAHRERVARMIAEQRVERMEQGDVDAGFPSPEIDLTDPAQREAAVEWYIQQITHGQTGSGASGELVTARETALAMHRARVDALMERRRAEQEAVARLTQNLLAPEEDLGDPPDADRAMRWFLRGYMASQGGSGFNPQALFDALESGTPMLDAMREAGVMGRSASGESGSQ